MVFILFTLYNHQYLIPKHCHHPQKKPHNHKQVIPITMTPLPALATTTFCLHESAYSRHLSFMESYNMWPFVISFSHLVYFQGSSVLCPVSVSHSFLWPGNTSPHGNTTLLWLASTS